MQVFFLGLPPLRPLSRTAAAFAGEVRDPKMDMAFLIKTFSAFLFIGHRKKSNGQECNMKIVVAYPNGLELGFVHAYERPSTNNSKQSSIGPR